MIRKFLCATAACLALAACGEGPPPPQPGETAKALEVDAPNELSLTYLGTVGGDGLYTTCRNGDRLYFWTHYRGNAMTIRPSDPTCEVTK